MIEYRLLDEVCTGTVVHVECGVIPWSLKVESVIEGLAHDQCERLEGLI